YSVVARFAGDSNYNQKQSAAATVTINKATPTVSVTGGTFTYDGAAHGANGFAYGAGGVADVLTTAVTFSYVGAGLTVYGPTVHDALPISSSVVAGCAGDSNYNQTESAAATVTINKATPTVSVTGGTFTYDGASHAASGFAYGVGGVADVLSPAVTFSYVGTGTTSYGPSATAPSNAGTYQVTATLAGNTNHHSAAN